MALSGYGVYAEVTFAASAVDEAIPFLTVYLSDLPTAWHDAMANAGDTDGRTIRVTKSDGTTECAIYVPPGSVDTGTDTGCLFFRATDLSAVLDTTYMIWVGNAASTMYLSTDTYGRNAVFYGYSGAYAGVYIFNSTDDCTGQGRDLTAVNSPGTAASGLEGITAATYNGSSSYHKYEGTQAVTDWPIAMEGLYSVNNLSHDGVVGILSRSSSTFPFLGMYVGGSTASDYLVGIARGNSGTNSSVNSTTTVAASTLEYGAVTRSDDSGNTWVYRNGGSAATNSGAVVTPTFDRFAIGAWISTSVSLYLNGSVTAIFLSDSVRSADYVSTMQDNWAGTLYTASAVMYVTGTTGKLKLQTATGASTSGSLADWSSAANSITIATDYASATIDDVTIIQTETLKLTNIAYNYAVPSGKSNYGLKFYLRRKRNTGGGLEVNDYSMRYINESGAFAGTDLADIAAVWPSGTSSDKTYTVAGVTLSDASFNSSTGFSVQATAFDSASTVDAQVEFICAEITWDEGAPATDYGNFFEAYGAFGNVA